MAIPNILNLSAYLITRFDETDDAYHIAAQPRTSPPVCVHCQQATLVGFGHREQWIRDLPMHGKRVSLYLRTRRFRCKSCGRTFYGPFPDVDAKRLMTRRLVAWMGNEAIRRPFAHVARDVGVDEATVRDVFHDWVADLEARRRVETPAWLGLDEIHLMRPRGVVTNVERLTLVDILVNRNKDTISRYLAGLPHHDRIQLVAMDMWRPYKDAVEATLPQATIVIDKFHVLKLANAAVDRVRKDIRGTLTPAQRRGLMHERFVLLKREADLTDREVLLLSTWVKNYPLLGAVHQQKEAFFRIYDARSRGDAHRLFQTWEQGLAPDLRRAFTDLLTAWHHWHAGILAYFDHPITNAYTESLNNLIRATDRMGRGYSFDALRAKMLWSQGSPHPLHARPKLTRQPPLADRVPAMGNAELRGRSGGLPRPAYAPDYGVDLATLAASLGADA